MKALFVSHVLGLVSGQYLVVGGGDDSALYAAQFNLVLDNNDVTKVNVTHEVSEPSAHTSSVTGKRRQEFYIAINHVWVVGFGSFVFF